MPPLTVTIITLNEAAHIGAAIDSAAFADENPRRRFRQQRRDGGIARTRGARC